MKEINIRLLLEYIFLLNIKTIQNHNETKEAYFFLFYFFVNSVPRLVTNLWKMVLEIYAIFRFYEFFDCEFKQKMKKGSYKKACKLYNIYR